MAYAGNITLIGMPGAGKSTLGVVLAKRLGLSFVDTDLVIQKQQGATLPQIIAEQGLEAFKQLEEQAITDLDVERHVIATGGSAVYGREAMEHLHELGAVVYLALGLGELNERLGTDFEARGIAMAQGMTLEALYAERAPLYEAEADVTMQMDGLSIREAVIALEALLEERGVL